MTRTSQEPLRVFCSYSHKDEEYLNELRAWLRSLERQGLIEWWHDREISPGWEWEEAIDKNLRTADVILLLVTPDFMNSDYVFEREIDRAIERHERGEARVVPIIVRPALWKWAPFGRLQALPKDETPITTWPNRDQAWLDVAEGIQKAVEELLVERRERAAAKERYFKAVEQAWVDDHLSDEEAEGLSSLASELGLSTETAADIERDVMGDTKEAILKRQEQTSRENERQDRLDELYARARRSHHNQEWQAVVDAFEQIHAEDPSYPDPAELLASAREALETLGRMQRVAALYDRSQRHIDAEEWQQALEFLEEVQQLEPGYRETEELLSRVRQELAPPSTVTVPDLSSRTILQARSTLSQRGLRLGAQNDVSSDTVPEGQIIEQSPEAGTDVEVGSSVSVTVSSGSSTVEVPDLAGKSRSEARSTLRAAGLELGTLATARSEDMPEGRIVEQHPMAGREVERGSSVRITVSSGVQEATVADLSGRSSVEGERAEALPSGSQTWDRSRVLSVIALVIVPLAIVVGFSAYYLSGPSEGDHGDSGLGGEVSRTFTFGRGVDSASLDPINATDSESLKVTSQVFDPLLDFAPESTDVIPGLATEVPKPEKGGQSYTFTLREGVKFHDGTPFNAEAVVFNFDRWHDTDNPYHKGGGSQGGDFSYYAAMFGGFDDDSVIEEVEALDEYTVRFTLREPQASFLQNIAMSVFGIASPTAIKEDVEGFWQEPVGTGPFKFVSWNRDSEVPEVQLEANKDWWGTDLSEEEGGGGPYVDKVVFRSISDKTSRVAALTGGRLSAADGLSPDDITTVKEARLEVAYRPPLTIGYLAMNTQKEPFDDPKARQAINMAIDVPKIVEAFYGDTGQVATTYIPPTVSFFDNSIERYPYDPDKAKQMLQEAGVGNLQTELWYPPISRTYAPDGKGIALAMKADLEKVGVNAKLVTFEWGTYLEKTSRGEHDMGLFGWTGDNGDPDNFLNVLLSSTTATETDALNIAYYKNPEVDRLLEQGQTTVDEAERRDAYYQVQEILHQDAPWVPIAYSKVPVGMQDQVQGYQPNPTGHEAFNTVRLGGAGA
jgi:peptide/nickel transport system substrate-binding protein